MKFNREAFENYCASEHINHEEDKDFALCIIDSLLVSLSILTEDTEIKSLVVDGFKIDDFYEFIDDKE